MYGTTRTTLWHTIYSAMTADDILPRKAIRRDTRGRFATPCAFCDAPMPRHAERCECGARRTVRA